MLAKVFGVYLLVISTAVLLSRKQIQASFSGVVTDPLNIYFSGAMLVLIGLLVVNLHSVWTLDYRLVITLLGWLTLAKGVGRLIWGERIIQSGMAIFNSTWYLLAIAPSFILGLWLTLEGYSLLSI